MTFLTVTTEDLRGHLLERLESSRETIRIACFEVSDSSVIECLNRKSREGIRVTVATEGRKTESTQVAMSKRSGIRHLISNPNDYWYALHLKVVIIDESVVLIGSSNFSIDSFDQNTQKF